MVTTRSSSSDEGLIQKGTCYSDGVPGVTQYPILPGGNLTLRFSASGQYGFYLMRVTLIEELVIERDLSQILILF